MVACALDTVRLANWLVMTWAQHQPARRELAKRPGVLVIQFVQLGDMGLQFVVVGPAGEVEAEHLDRS